MGTPTKINKFALRNALAQLDEAGIEIGDAVRYSWKVDEAYGGGTRSHEGILKTLDRERGWIEISPSTRSPGHLRTSIVAHTKLALEKLEGEEAERVVEQLAFKPTKDGRGGPRPKQVAPHKRKRVGTNPFVEKAKKTGNPFIDKAKT